MKLSSLLALRGLVMPTGVGLGLVAIIVLTMFAFGSVTGGSAAMNESVTLDETHHEVTIVMEDAREDITANTSGARGVFTLSTWDTIMALSSPAIHTGIDIGHQYPGIVPYLAGGIKWLNIAIGLGMVFSTLRKALPGV